jgi:hypothetical protein
VKDICHILIGAFFIVAFVVASVSSCSNMSSEGIAERVCHPYSLAAYDADAKVIVCYTEKGMVLREWPAEKQSPRGPYSSHERDGGMQ